MTMTSYDVTSSYVLREQDCGHRKGEVEEDLYRDRWK